MDTRSRSTTILTMGYRLRQQGHCQFWQTEILASSFDLLFNMPQQQMVRANKALVTSLIVFQVQSQRKIHFIGQSKSMA